MSNDTAKPLAEKGVFDKVLTATPVILTIVATFLIGQSSSEMTQAQYHRATASQNQSKVGDQWAFFQAKRIRGTSYEVTAELLSALRDSEPFTGTTLPAAADALAQQAAAAEKIGADHTAALAKSKDQTAAGKLTQKIAGMKEIAQQTAKAAGNVRGLLNAEAGAPPQPSADGVALALAALAEPGAKARAGKSGKKEENPETVKIQAALEAIRTRQPEKDIALLALGISDGALHDAIAAAESSADLVYRKGKQIEAVLEELDKLVEAQLALARRFTRIVAEITDELSGSADLEPGQAAPRAARGLEQRARTISSVSERLLASYKSARHAFTARRYEEDARSNQDAAYLYEIKVALSAARSDRHLARSKNFMYAMLIAQAGVAIATLALAVRQKSVMWLLATAAGLAAIGFGVYVFLGME